MENHLHLTLDWQHPSYYEPHSELGWRYLGTSEINPDGAPVDHLAHQLANRTMKKPAFALRVDHHQPVYDIAVVVIIDDLQIW
ncbi:hypothetical protein EN811_29370, partial [bacterium M00.F.Ca.ET.168.01.1.1]